LVKNSGAFSEVKRATERTSGIRYAVKVIDKAKCRGKESMIQSEVEILKRVQHRNIIRLFEMYESNQKIFLIMEMYAPIFVSISTFVLVQNVHANTGVGSKLEVFPIHFINA
jgi:serine/threonine protein kinase